ncbi:MAG: radical SAM protein [Clostridiales bacterium]|jgi:anaerobic ribonucleoside-triphosphate reductase activating protein|nr:radical SAM protein [Clostridiales bacterium]
MSDNAAQTIRVAGIVNDSITDGPGLRLAIFMQGCLRGCPGCHNPSALPLKGGEPYSAAALYDRVKANPLLSGVTFSGGEPLLQAAALIPLAKKIRRAGYALSIYTGYTFETLLNENDADKLSLLRCADTLVDGPFILAERDLSLLFRGSKNQRILDVAQSLKKGYACPQTAPGWQKQSTAPFC